MYNDILYTVNKKYRDIFLASLYSLLENGNLSNVRIHLVTDGFTKEDFDKVDRIIGMFPGTLINYYNLNCMNIEALNIPNWRGSQIANARLFIDSILDLHDVYNLLYIDADTIVVGPLNELKEKSSREVVCAVLDGASKRYGQELGGLDKYFNSGIIYFNINNWIGIEAEDRIRYTLKNNDKELRFPDQDLFNLALNGFISELPLEYNMAPYAYCFNDSQLKRYFNTSDRCYGYNEVIKGKEKAKILHSVGLFGIKPWMENDVNPFNDLFLEYLYKVDPYFTLEELPLMKKLFTYNKDLFYALIVNRQRMPKPLVELGNKLSLSLQQTKKK